MTLKTRIKKLEERHNAPDFLVVVLGQNETEADCYRRLVAEGKPLPKAIIYVDEWDLEL